jgi:hypothetical protein
MSMTIQDGNRNETLPVFRNLSHCWCITATLPIFFPNELVDTSVAVRCVCPVHYWRNLLGGNEYAGSLAMAEESKPIDMLLFCPVCHLQHIDKDETPSDREWSALSAGDREIQYWTNPPHNSHLCAFCKTVWRPADVPTNGVAAIQTRGKKDSWPSLAPLRAGRAVDEFPTGVGDTLRHTWQPGQIWQTRIIELGPDSLWTPVQDKGTHEPAWDHLQEYRRIR